MINNSYIRQIQIPLELPKAAIDDSVNGHLNFNLKFKK